MKMKRLEHESEGDGNLTEEEGRGTMGRAGKLKGRGGVEKRERV